MNLKWFYAIFALLINANALSCGEIEASFQLTGLEYEDACLRAAELQWNFTRNPNKIALQSWINASIDYGSLKCIEEGRINDAINGSIPNKSIEYKYNLISKPGDALLECDGDNSWKSLVNFIGNVEYFKLTGNYSITPDGYKLFRKDAENLLSRSGKIDDKLKTWNAWYELLMPLTNEFSSNMRLITKAAIANDANNVTKYWEMLSEYDGGYEESVGKWKEISPLHRKFVKFVKTRLHKKYGGAIEGDLLPAHLLRSLQGYDWTPLALDIIPHASIVYELRKNLLEKGFVGKHLYKSASRLANSTLKHLPEANFFDESEFDGECPSKLINLCDKGRMRISTCFHSSITNYVSAHKNIAKVLIHQMSEESNPILNFANRYSALEDGISELFGILSARSSWLHLLNLINETHNNEDTRIVSLMITALNILPRLAYYHSADMWRIDSLKNNTLKPQELIYSWWEYRSLYEGISASSKKLPTFLDDNIIISNRPYLSKFIGTILAFQIYEYLVESADVMLNKDEIIPMNPNLIKMIQHGCAENWYDIAKQYLAIYEINVNPLLSYFAPLEQYIDEYEIDNDAVMSGELEKNLEKLEYDMKNINKPIVTIPVTMNSTIVDQSMETPIERPSVKKENTESRNSHQSEVSSIKSDVNSEIQADTTRAPGFTPIPVKIDAGTSVEEGQVVKGTSKAVWAVSAALIAIVSIIIISIFGRRRCRKTPKNRSTSIFVCDCTSLSINISNNNCECNNENVNRGKKKLRRISKYNRPSQ